jgi:hypothetical protein
MNLSTHNTNPFSMPRWVFEAGAQYRLEELNEVKTGTTGIVGVKAVPVFDDKIYLQKLEKFFLAMGKKYDGDPRLTFINIRLFGNWGEGHIYPFSDKALPGEVPKRHIQLHLNAFKKTQLILPYRIKEYEPIYDWAVTQGIAIRRDGVGGNSDGRETIRCIGKTPAVFELFGSYDFHKQQGWWDGKTVNGHGYTLADCVEMGFSSR